MAPRLLTLPQVAEIVDVEYRTLHGWLRRGLINPSFQESSGTGVPNLFGAPDVVQAKVIADLRSYGLQFERLQEASKRLEEHPEALSDGAFMLVNGSVSIVAETEAAEAIRNESLTLIYNTRHAIREINQIEKVLEEATRDLDPTAGQPALPAASAS